MNPLNLVTSVEYGRLTPDQTVFLGNDSLPIPVYHLIGLLSSISVKVEWTKDLPIGATGCTVDKKYILDNLVGTLDTALSNEAKRTRNIASIEDTWCKLTMTERGKTKTIFTKLTDKANPTMIVVTEYKYNNEDELNIRIQQESPDGCKDLINLSNYGVFLNSAVCPLEEKINSREALDQFLSVSNIPTLDTESINARGLDKEEAFKLVLEKGKAELNCEWFWVGQHKTPFILAHTSGFLISGSIDQRRLKQLVIDHCYKLDNAKIDFKHLNQTFPNKNLSTELEVTEPTNILVKDSAGNVTDKSVILNYLAEMTKLVNGLPDMFNSNDADISTIFNIARAMRDELIEIDDRVLEERAFRERRNGRINLPFDNNKKFDAQMPRNNKRNSR